MPRWLPTLLLPLAAALVALGIGYALGRQTTHGDPVAAAASRPSRIVRLGPQRVRTAGIRTVEIVRRPIARTLDLVGSVDFDPDRVADVGSRIEGRVVSLAVSLGARVVRGQALAEIDGPAVGQAVADLLSARARLGAARANARRENALAVEQLTSGVAVEQAHATESSLAGEARGAEQRLLTMGFTVEDVAAMSRGQTRHVVLRAPIDGEVVARQVVLGQVVADTEELLRIADLGEVWVLLDVHEGDLGAVHRSDVVAITADADRGTHFDGRVDYVEPTVDVRTRTARVRVRVPTPDHALRPGQFVRASVQLSGDETPELVLPRSALLDIEGEPTVFVARGGDAFEARSVSVGAANGEMVAIMDGLAEGERVAIAGTFALKSELLR